MPVECPICFNDFDTGDHMPYVGTCGHSVCGTCRIRLLRECPSCKTPDAFLERRRNFQLIDSLNAPQMAARRAASEHVCHNCKSGVLLERALICISCLKEPKLAANAMLKALLCRNCAAAGGGHGHQIKKAQEMLLISKSVKLRDETKAGMNLLLQSHGFLTASLTDKAFEDLHNMVANMGAFKTNIAEFIEAERQLTAITQKAAEAYLDAINRMKKAQQLLVTANQQTKAILDKSVPFTEEEREVFNIEPRTRPSTAPSSSRTGSTAASRTTTIPRTTKPATTARRPLATVPVRRN